MEENNNYKRVDTMTLILQWPCTFFIMERKGSVNSIPYEMQNSFTIHGFRATTGPGVYPPPLTPVANINESWIAEHVRNDLRQYWPDLRGRTRGEFWQEQYKKHGGSQTGMGVATYFARAVEAYEKVNIMELLAKANMHPGGSYFPGDFLKALRSALGVECWISCHKDQATGQQHVREIGICFSRRSVLKNCNYKLPTTNCDPHRKLVWQPLNVKKSSRKRKTEVVEITATGGGRTRQRK